MGAPDGQRRASCGFARHALAHDPVRRHAPFRPTRHHQADFGGLLARQEAAEQLAEREVRKAAAEIVDQPVTFSLREHGNDATRIDAPLRNRGLNSGNVVRRGRRDAVDLRNRHLLLRKFSPLRIRSYAATNRLP